jgi:hypothetical protein
LALLDLHDNRGAIAYGIEAYRDRKPTGVAKLRRGRRPRPAADDDQRQRVRPAARRGDRILSTAAARRHPRPLSAGDGDNPWHRSLPVCRPDISRATAASIADFCND